MKALILNILYYPNEWGGAEKVTQLYAEGLQEMGVEPVVVSLGPRAGLGWVNGIKVYYLPLKNFFFPSCNKANQLSRMLWHLVDIYNPLMAIEVGKIIDKEKPDLVHTNVFAGFSVSIWSAIKRRGLPIIHTLHDYYLFCPRSSMFRNRDNCLSQCFTCRIFSYPKRGFTALVDRVVGVSSFILERHKKAGFFPNAIKQTIYNPIPRKKQPPRSHQEGKIRFGYIGRLSKPKGVEDLLAVFKTMDPLKASLTLAGTGESSYVAWLQERYRATNIAFLGFVPADDFYKQISVVVVPSRWQEPLPTVVLEAYSHGLPLIGARRGGIPEMVEHGRTGFLFEPDNAAELALHMRKFLEEPGLYREIAKNSWEKAGEFSPSNTIRRYYNLYNNVL